MRNLIDLPHQQRCSSVEAGLRTRPFTTLQSRKRTCFALLPALLVFAQLAAPVATDAATVWNGPPISFSKSGAADPTMPANQDRITANVWLTRGSSQGLYNAKTEAGFTHFFSPADTRWASGTTA